MLLVLKRPQAVKHPVRRCRYHESRNASGIEPNYFAEYINGRRIQAKAQRTYYAKPNEIRAESAASC